VLAPVDWNLVFVVSVPFGLLGTIAVVAGRLEGDTLAMDAWVMSCRAFARRIEHQTLKVLFETTGAAHIDFSLVATARNGPLREFMVTLLGKEPQSDVRLTRSQFLTPSKQQASLRQPETCPTNG